LKSQIAELMVNYPDAGISYNMTYDQAIGLARNAASAQQAWQRSIQEQQLAISRAGAGIGAPLTTAGLNVSNFDDLMNAALQSGAAPQEAAQVAYTQALNLGWKLTPADLSTFTNRANQLQTQLPTATTPPQAGGVFGFLQTAVPTMIETAKTTIGGAISLTTSFFNRLFSK
jgi:hypothetical protein